MTLNSLNREPIMVIALIEEKQYDDGVISKDLPLK